MNHNSRTTTIAAALLAMSTAAIASASPYNTHWGISVSDSSALVTENWQGGVGYLGESRVFAFNAQDFGGGAQFFDIGTNSVGGTFATPGVIGFDFMTGLQRFNGSGFDSVSETLTFQFGPLSATSGSGFVEGFGTAVRDETTHPSSPGQWGRHHTHYNIFIDGADPADGIYMMEFTLWYEAGDGNPTSYASSKSFWTLFNLNGSDADVISARAWVETNLVPAPGAIAVLALLGVAGSRRRRNA